VTLLFFSVLVRLAFKWRQEDLYSLPDDKEKTYDRKVNEKVDNKHGCSFSVPVDNNGDEGSTAAPNQTSRGDVNAEDPNAQADSEAIVASRQNW
jgi:hypothetical protein